MKLTLHVDGGSRGNPGPAGAGVVLTSDGTPVFEAGYYLGRQTNNAAEYLALIHGLDRARALGARSLEVYADSELLVKQLTGVYAVKSPALRPLFEQAQRGLLGIPSWQIQHVYRDNNRRADELANRAMDTRQVVVATDTESVGSGVDHAADDEVEIDARPASGPGRAESSPGKSQADTASSARRVRIQVERAGDTQACPAGGCGFEALSLGPLFESRICLHAAHALLPAVLGIQNTDGDEFAAVPPMTVACTNHACGARFVLSPQRSDHNGKH